MTSSPVIAVTGASGQLGRRVVELLLEAGAHVVAATRDPARLGHLAARGVEVRRADFDDPASLEKAFSGVDRLLLVSTDVLGQGTRRIEQHARAVAAAKQAGVRHVAYTSIVGADQPSKVAVTPDHRATEEAIRAAGLGYTFLRNGLYTENLLGSLPRALASGQHFAAAADGATAYVAREDCARAAAAALLSAGGENRVIEVTGPEALTQADVVRIASDLTGRPAAYVPVPAEAIRAQLVQVGLPEPLAAAIVSFDEGIAAGEYARASDGFERLTGARPTDVRTFLEQHREALTKPPG